MQGLSLLLAVIISRAVASPIAQTANLDGPFDIALSSFDDAGIATAGSFQIAASDTPSQAPSETPSETPSDAPPRVAQPGDPVFQKQPQSKPKVPIQTPGKNNPAEEPKNSNQPFDCGPGKSGACCVGGTRDGMTQGCIRFKPYDDWCQKSEWFKCCKSQPEKDAQIEAGTILDDHSREECEDPKQIIWDTQQDWGSNLLRMIFPQGGGGIESGGSIPQGVWVPNQ